MTHSNCNWMNRDQQEAIEDAANSIRRKAAIYDHLHQPGEITQEFADAVSKGCVKLIHQGRHMPWVLSLRNSNLARRCFDPYAVRSLVKDIRDVLLILHAYGIEITWPRKG